MRIAEFLRSICGYESIIEIELLKEHSLGLTKYKSLIDAGEDLIIPDYNGVSDDEMKKYKDELMSLIDVPIVICRI